MTVHPLTTIVLSAPRLPPSEAALSPVAGGSEPPVPRVLPTPQRPVARPAPDAGVAPLTAVVCHTAYTDVVPAIPQDTSATVGALGYVGRSLSGNLASQAAGWGVRALAGPLAGTAGAVVQPVLNTFVRHRAEDAWDFVYGEGESQDADRAWAQRAGSACKDAVRGAPRSILTGAITSGYLGGLVALTGALGAGPAGVMACGVLADATVDGALGLQRRLSGNEPPPSWPEMPSSRPRLPV